MRRLLPLCLLALAGCDGLSLTTGDATGDYGNVVWSEARGEAVLVGDDGLALFDPASGDVRPVSTARELFGEVRVAVSPDGRFAYTEAPEPGGDPNYDARHVWRTDLDSGARTRVAEDASRPLLSPDGRTLYVTRTRQRDSTYAVPLAGGARRVIGAGWPAALAPDGSQILLARQFGRGVFVHDLATGAETPTGLTEQDLDERDELKWVPEGLFALRIERPPLGEEGTGQTRFILADVLGGTETVLWEGAEEATYRYPRWAWRPAERDALVSTTGCSGSILYPTSCTTRVESLRYVSAGEDRDLGDRLGDLSDATVTPSGLLVYVRRTEGTYEAAAVPMRDLGAR